MATKPSTFIPWGGGDCTPLLNPGLALVTSYSKESDKNDVSEFLA